MHSPALCFSLFFAFIPESNRSPFFAHISIFILLLLLHLRLVVIVWFFICCVCLSSSSLRNRLCVPPPFLFVCPLRYSISSSGFSSPSSSSSSAPTCFVPYRSVPFVRCACSFVLSSCLFVRPPSFFFPFSSSSLPPPLQNQIRMRESALLRRPSASSTASSYPSAAVFNGSSFPFMLFFLCVLHPLPPLSWGLEFFLHHHHLPGISNSSSSSDWGVQI